MMSCPVCDEFAAIEEVEEDENGITIYNCMHCNYDFGYNQKEDRYIEIEQL